MKRSVQPRRAPVQERSRERVEHLLAVTRRLVGQRGNDAVSMREIAAEAGVPISSVYQYYPDKTALLRAIIVQYLDEIRTRLARALGGVATLDDLVDAIDRLIDDLLAMFRSDRDLAPIWTSVLANAVLREHDMKDTREIAEGLAAVLRPLVPAADPSEVLDVALYLAHIVFYALRVAHHAPRDDAQRIVREQKRLIALRLTSLAGSARPRIAEPRARRR